MHDLDIPGIENALSLERFSRYLGWADGDRARALALYTLNTQLSECLYTPIQTLEVVLRNRIHAVLTQATHDRWFDEPSFQLGSYQAEQVAKAKQDLTEEGKPLEPGRIVAALTFSYWTAFFGTAYENLWRKTLKDIARRSDGKLLARKHFSTPLTPIRILRNRIAHHEPILDWNIPKHHERMIEMTEWLSPPAADWCRRHCRFPEVYPADGIVLHRPASGM